MFVYAQLRINAVMRSAGLCEVPPFDRKSNSRVFPLGAGGIRQDNDFIYKEWR
jgi:hypothetical protein